MANKASSLCRVLRRRHAWSDRSSCDAVSCGPGNTWDIRAKSTRGDRTRWGVHVVPVHVEGFVALTNQMFPSIASVTNVTTVGVIEVGQPFQGCVGIRFALSMLTTDGFGGQLTYWHVFGAVEEIAGGGDGDTALQRIETADLFEFLTKDLAGPFEQQHIGFAIGHEFSLEIEDVLEIVLRVPPFQFLGSLDGNALGIVVFVVGRGPT